MLLSPGSQFGRVAKPGVETNCGDLVAVYHTKAQPQKPPAIHHICLLRYYGGGVLDLGYV
jgi:hypothetical protein